MNKAASFFSSLDQRQHCGINISSANSYILSSVMSFMKFNELKFICRSFQLDELDHLSVHCANELDHEFIVHFSVHFFIVYWNVVLHTRCIHVGPSHSMFYKGHQSKFRKNKDQGLVCVRKIRISNSKSQAVKSPSFLKRSGCFSLFLKAASFKVFIDFRYPLSIAQRRGA